MLESEAMHESSSASLHKCLCDSASNGSTRNMWKEQEQEQEQEEEEEEEE